MTANKKTFLPKHCLKFFSNTVSLFVRMRNICCRNKMFLKKFRNILNIFLFLGNKKCFHNKCCIFPQKQGNIEAQSPAVRVLVCLGSSPTHCGSHIEGCLGATIILPTVTTLWIMHRGSRAHRDTHDWRLSP